MPSENSRTSFYLRKVREQIEYFNYNSFGIWICGVIFTRLAADTWFGPRPLFVMLIILSVVYLYMHFGYYQTILMRLPIVLLAVYLTQTHLLQPGDFLLQQPVAISWPLLFVAWGAMNFSFVVRGEDYPFKFGGLHGVEWHKASSSEESGNIIEFRRKQTG